MTSSLDRQGCPGHGLVERHRGSDRRGSFSGRGGCSGQLAQIGRQRESELASRLPGSVYVQADVADPEQSARLVDEVSSASDAWTSW